MKLVDVTLVGMRKPIIRKRVDGFFGHILLASRKAIMTMYSSYFEKVLIHEDIFIQSDIYTK